MTRGACIARLASMIAAVERPHPARVALDGVDGAGKTHLADELVGPLSRSGRQIIRASIDGFHYPRAHRYKRGRESADGYFHDSFNYGQMRSQLLAHGLSPLLEPFLFNHVEHSEPDCA